MKRISALLLFYLLLLVTLFGCNNADTLIKEVNLKGLNNDVRSFIDKFNNANGLYLYSSVGKEEYLIIKYSYVLQGEEAKFIGSVKAQVHDQTLVINIEELGTRDYNDSRLENTTIFHLSKAQEYERIQIFKNGEEIGIDAVGT